MLKITAISFGLVWLCSPTAMAAPIPITSGSVDITVTPEDIYHPIRFSLNGPGISFIGERALASLFACVFPYPPCAHGTEVFDRAEISSVQTAGVHGTVILGGESFAYHASEAPGAPSADLTFRYNFVLAAVGPDPPNSLTVTGPFTTGLVIFAAPFTDPFYWPGPPLEFNMSGQGTVTANFQLATTGLPGPGTFYNLQSLHFDFFAVPEPGTTSLILPALAGLWAFSRRRQTL